MLQNSAIPTTDRPAPRWLHAWAIFTLVPTSLLLLIGGLVTTYRVGMADPDWPSTPWHLAFIDWTEPGSGYLIEHSHRLAGYFVGLCSIVLAVGCWNTRYRWLGLAALIGVILQGLLGGFRVVLDELAGTDLAAFHGVFGQCVFCVLVAAAVMTGKPPRVPLADAERARLRTLSLWLVGFAFVQLIWGAMIRHTPTPLAQRGHFLTAFLVIATGVMLIRAAFSSPTAKKRLGTAATCLTILFAIQVTLGVEAWLGKFGTGELPELQQVSHADAAVRTAHTFVGSWVLATSVIMALIIRREPEES